MTVCAVNREFRRTQVSLAMANSTHGCWPGVFAISMVTVLVAAMSDGFGETEASVAPPCRPRYKDCDNDPSNGCETYIGGDVANCGACGAPCYNLTGGPLYRTHVSCSNGTCVYVCDQMMGNCDYDIMSNGCETDLGGNDPNNCGECATSCPDYTSGSLPHAPGGADAPQIYVHGNVTSSAGDRVQPPRFKLITTIAHMDWNWM